MDFWMIANQGGVKMLPCQESEFPDQDPWSSRVEPNMVGKSYVAQSKGSRVVVWLGENETLLFPLFLHQSAQALPA